MGRIFGDETEYIAKFLLRFHMRIIIYRAFTIPVAGIERHGIITEQPFDATAPAHLFGRQARQAGRVDKGYRIGERQGDIQLVSGKRMHLFSSCASRASSVHNS